METPEQFTKRNARRRHLIFYLRVFRTDTKKDEFLGYIADVSHKGIMLMSEGPLPTGETHTMRIGLKDIEQGEDIINITGKSLWCKKDEVSGFYDTGYKLTDINFETVERIQKLISDVGFDDVEMQ